MMRPDRPLKEILERLQKEETDDEERRISMAIPRLVKLGLREVEAEAWLKREPNYDRPIIRRSYHQDRSDGKLPEPGSTLAITA